MVFWSKKEVTESTDKESEATKQSGGTELGQMESILNDVLGENKNGSSSLRDKASSRAEALDLQKFPVCINLY